VPKHHLIPHKNFPYGYNNCFPKKELGMLAGARRLLLLLAALASPFATADTGSEFSKHITELRAASYLIPRTTLQRLRALEEKSQPLTPAQQGQALEVAVSAQFWLRDPDEGLRLVSQIERLATEQHDNRLGVMALMHRAYISSKKLHDAPLARKLFYQANQLAATTNDVYVQVQGLSAIGMVDAEDGNPAAGLVHLNRAVELAHSADNRDALIMALKAQASTLADLKDFDAALASVDELVALSKRRGLPLQVVRADLTDNEIASRAGRAARARAALRDAVTILEALHADECLPRVLVKLAEADTRAGNYIEASQLSERARRLASVSGDPDDLALAEFEAGVTQVYLGKLVAGQRMADRSLAHFRNQETYVPMMLNYGQALAVAGAADAALKVYADAGSVGLASWRKDKEQARESVIKASEIQRKDNENEVLNRENAIKQSELRSTRKLEHMWWVLSIVFALGCATSAMLYRRVRIANRSLRTLNDVLYNQSTSDALTGLRNRNFFYEYVSTSTGAGRPGSATRPDIGNGLMGVFFLLDVDHFKMINDTYGHAVGDEVLRTVSKRLAASVRTQDVLVRWGGEEFLIFMPGVSATGARDTAKRLLEAVAAESVTIDGGAIKVTVSLGFSVTPMSCDGKSLTWEQQVHLADLALYLAKAEGRNRAYGVCGPRELSTQIMRAIEEDLKRASLQQRVDVCTVPGPVQTPVKNEVVGDGVLNQAVIQESGLVHTSSVAIKPLDGFEDMRQV
jgi:diguanylate cyclase (GGDEF)-like protein